jgi:hypothetical protein
MAKRALSAVAGFLSLCLPLFAQQSDPIFSALNSSTFRLPSLTLSDGGSFSFLSAVERATPDFLPALSMANMTASSRRTSAAAAPTEDSSKEIVNARPNFFDYASGETGVLYGRSTGKYGGDVEAGYIFGEVGNDKLQISAGMSYERSSVRFPRFGH